VQLNNVPQLSAEKMNKRKEKPLDFLVEKVGRPGQGRMPVQLLAVLGWE
jgi:hypothetical protein